MRSWGERPTSASHPLNCIPMRPDPWVQSDFPVPVGKEQRIGFRFGGSWCGSDQSDGNLNGSIFEFMSPRSTGLFPSFLGKVDCCLFQERLLQYHPDPFLLPVVSIVLCDLRSIKCDTDVRCESGQGSWCEFSMRQDEVDERTRGPAMEKTVSREEMINWIKLARVTKLRVWSTA